MSEHSLTFRFRGICTHFRFGVVAGVPHRVVLVDASQIRTGRVMVHGITPEPVDYYLTPHFAQLELESGSADLSVAGLLRNGDVISAVRLQVMNALDDEMNYDGERNVPRLTEFVPDYAFSSEVVQAGRAACYLDLFGGTVWSIPPADPSQPIQVFIKVRTDGPPKLLVSPLQSGTRQSYRLDLTKDGDPADITLVVRNLEVPQERRAEEHQGEFDYLLHYLTARGGIPQTIVSATPGMIDLRSATPEQIGLALVRLGDVLLADRSPGVFSEDAAPGKRRLLPQGDVTPACSDSNYP